MTPLRLLIIGAHPDDADYAAGGIASHYCAADHRVHMVSLTNGDAGHHVLAGPSLAQRRWQEAQNSAAVIGATYEIFDIHDGELAPSLENRHRVVALIRNFKPDLVLTHRPNDYHPDHRYTSQLVQDAAYMVTVPYCVPSAPFLAKDPVIAYVPDFFRKPTVFEPTVAIDVGPVVDKIVNMLHQHTSQFYEWLPFNRGELDKLPAGATQRRDWLRSWFLPKLRQQADLYRDLLVKHYGKERGMKVEYAEGFEGCEYGAPLDTEAQRRLFPFLPGNDV